MKGWAASEAYWEKGKGKRTSANDDASTKKGGSCKIWGRTVKGRTDVKNARGGRKTRERGVRGLVGMAVATGGRTDDLRLKTLHLP